MHIQNTSASPIHKPLMPWINNGPVKPIAVPTPKPIDSNPVKPLHVASTKPLVTGPKGPAAAPVSTVALFKGPATLQTSGLESHELTVANPNAKPDPQTLTLDGLAKAWGTGDSTYDFTGDGVVNVQDLLYMMDNWELFRPSTSLQTAPEGELVTADEPAFVTESASMAAKIDPGLEEKSATLDSGLTELVPDELKPESQAPAELTDVPSMDTAEPPPSEFGPSAETAPAPASDSAAPATSESLNLRAYLDSLRSADGRRVAAAGLNGAAARAAIAPTMVRDTPAAHSMGGLKPLADSLFNHLSSAGFADQPPTNIRELVDALNFSPRQTDFMLKQLMVKYPQGLGVNVVA